MTRYEGKAILVDGEVLPVSDLTTWSKWYETADRTVAQVEIGGVVVSTVFLGLNYEFNSSLPAMWFETIVVGGFMNGESVRYGTLEAAMIGHEQVVARVQALGL